MGEILRSDSSVRTRPRSSALPARLHQPYQPHIYIPLAYPSPTARPTAQRPTAPTANKDNCPLRYPSPRRQASTPAALYRQPTHHPGPRIYTAGLPGSWLPGAILLAHNPPRPATQPLAATAQHCPRAYPSPSIHKATGNCPLRSPPPAYPSPAPPQMSRPRPPRSDLGRCPRQLPPALPVTRSPPDVLTEATQK